MMWELVTRSPLLGVTLTRQDMWDVMGAFFRYLLLEQSFRETMDQCAQPGRDSPAHRREYKRCLEALLGSPDYAIVYRCAALKVAAGNLLAPHAAGLDFTEIQGLLVRNRAHARRALDGIVHDVGLIGMSHAQQIWNGVMTRTRPHASKFAYRRTRFLSIGESGHQHDDSVADLLMMGMRTFRWYYPFRGGTHMDNSVRTAMTNRGLSYIKKKTRQCRSRLIVQEDGSVLNMEASNDVAMNNFVGSVSTERDANLRLDIAKLAKRPDFLGDVSQFLTDHLEQERFMEWLVENYPRVLGSGDLTEAIRRTGKTFETLLSGFYEYDQSIVNKTLAILRKAVA